jgi:RNA-directed DNA polymerase
MHEREQSDPAIGAGKPTNKAEATSVVDAAEPVEQRAGAKGNAGEQSTHRIQSRERVSQALDRVRKAATLCRHHPRREPYALIGLVRICAGGAG